MKFENWKGGINFMEEKVEEMFSSKSLSHGGNLLYASKEFGVSEFLDYSSNINPLGVPSEYKKLIIENIDKLASYPNIDYLELKEAIANYLSIDKAFVLPTNGATEAIYLILQILNIKKVLIPVPSFSEYENACRNFNVDVKWQFTKEENDFQVDVEELAFNIKNKTIDSIFLCNPNNPTSQLIEKDKILYLLNLAKENNIYILIDESFIDLIKGEEDYTLRNYIEKYDNLIIIQSFTKFFAVPGIRIGAALCSDKIVDKIFESKMPWSINYFASLIAKILKKDSEYVLESKKWIENEVEAFYNELKKIKGLKVFKPKTNFVLIKIEDERFNSKTLREALGKKGILIRDCSNFKGLNDRFVRFAIKDKKRNSEFLEGINNIFNVDN